MSYHLPVYSYGLGFAYPLFSTQYINLTFIMSAVHAGMTAEGASEASRYIILAVHAGIMNVVRLDIMIGIKVDKC